MKIVTDSTADLPREIVEEYNIEIVPLTVKLGDRAFRDYYDVSPPEFFQMLKQTDDFPTSSQPSVEEFLSTYKKLGKDEEIISVHISASMSATSQSAGIAMQQLPGWNVKIIDSRTTSIGLGIIVLEAAKAIKAGANKDEVINLIEKLKPRVRIYFSVDNLDHLQKGGRIGKAQAFLGTMLKIKPLLTVEDGIVAPVEKIRGSNKLISRIAELVRKDSEKKGSVKAGFICGEDKEQMEGLIRQIRNEVQFDEFYKNYIGTVITTHAGPTAFGIGYYCGDI